MIALLTGTVASVDTASAVIDVNGVGYEVHMPQADLGSMHTGQQVTVHTVMSVAQDAVNLQGFLSLTAKRMFLKLLKVNGIGPKVALSLLSTLQGDALAHAIADGDAAALARAPGLGKKGAQKIILELKGSIDLDAIDGVTQSAQRNAPEDTGRAQVIEGLMSLGWHQQDAVQAVQTVIDDHDFNLPLDVQDVPTVLRLALNALDSGR